MSRIGKVPVTIPDKVDVKINDSLVSVKGPNGQIEYKFTDNVKIEIQGKEVVITPKNNSKICRALWGTTRAVIGNMVKGVSVGFTKKLEFMGVGYKASTAGNIITLNLGYSHPIDYKLADGITAKIVKNEIELLGINKELLGQVAAEIRALRPPEPYKGKGIRYKDEIIVRKAGKTGVKA